MFTGGSGGIGRRAGFRFQWVTVGVQIPSPAPKTLSLYKRKWLSGRASPCQGEGRGFESRLPLQFKTGASKAPFFIF
jgi:hypothetical protein